MSQNTKHKPRLYADFNKWDGDGKTRWLILACKGTSDDLARLNLEFTEGLEVTFYADDSDSNGNDNDIEVDGYLHYDKNVNQWIGIVDWSAIRHSSDQQGNKEHDDL